MLRNLLPARVLSAVFVVLATGCTGQVQDFCNNETPCEDPEKPFCDFAGDFGDSNTCIPDPTRDAGLADAGPGPDAVSTPSEGVDAAGVDATPPCECEADEVACTTDVCDVSGAACTAIPTHDNCSDPAAPFCHPTQGCVAQTCATAEDCDDGVFCNGEEVCEIASGETVGLCGAGTAPVINDGIGCTIDSCNEAAGRVEHIANDSVCSDGLFCNGAETCSVTADCQAGTPPFLGDGVPCTIDSCNEVADRVEHAPSDAACNDGLFCNGSETCSATLGCRAGTAPVTNDGIACTTDACDESLDLVTHTPVDSVCNDGLFCNGAEVCNAMAGCQGGTPPILSDGVSCTTDTCDEGADVVVHTAEDSACDDGLFCNGVETCDADGGCESGVAPTCSASDVCIASNSCNEATNACNPVMETFSFRYTVSGAAGGTGTLTCGGALAAFTDTAACDSDPSIGLRYECAIDDQGRLNAQAVGFGSFFCLGPFGPQVTSGCSTINVTDPVSSRIFSCCFD